MLEGQVALVTGGAAGIGRAIVEGFVAAGARVGVLDRSPVALEDLAQGLGARVLPIEGDVTSLEDNRRAVKEVVVAFGHLDVFVGNAGIGDQGISLLDIPEEKLSAAFDELYGVNVKGYLLGARAAHPEVAKANGSMIFTASFSSFAPGGGGALYVSAKHAVAGIVRQLAYEFAPEVRVNAVAPGIAPTALGGLTSLGQQPQTALLRGIESCLPLGFVPSPADHAGAYIFLASRESSAVVTGTLISTDSGLQVRGITRVAGRLSSSAVVRDQSVARDQSIEKI